MSPYELGVRQALVDVGLIKVAWKTTVLPALAATGVGAGLGAVFGDDDPARGALVGALGGLGAYGGARLGGWAAPAKFWPKAVLGAGGLAGGAYGGMKLIPSMAPSRFEQIGDLVFGLEPQTLSPRDVMALRRQQRMAEEAYPEWYEEGQLPFDYYVG